MGLHYLGVPFPMPACLTEDKRHRYMLTALQFSKEFGWPHLEALPVENKTISIIGYGPSLVDTWKNITRPIMTMSGAHDFLIEGGVIPDFHCDMDPRIHKVEMLTPHKEVKYLMATVCNPNFWPKLKGFDVSLWHAVSGDRTESFINRKYPEKSLMVSGGSCMGLVALHLAGCLGYNHFELHGYDGSYRDEKRHAGAHGGYPHGTVDTKIWGKWYKTSKMMENANYELQSVLQSFPIFCVFHGEGRNQRFADLSELPNVALHGTPRAESVRGGKVVYTTPEEAQKLLAA